MGIGIRSAFRPKQPFASCQCRGLGIRARISPDRRSRKARVVRFDLEEEEWDVMRGEAQALAEQSDRFVRNGGGGSCRPPAGDDYLNDHEPIGSIRCVAGEAGIYHEVIPVDLEKAVEAVCSVITGGHLSF